VQVLVLPVSEVRERNVITNAFRLPLFQQVFPVRHLCEWPILAENRWPHIGRKLTDRKADEEMVAFKLMMWAWKLGKERRGGLSTPQFVRAGLMGLEMGEDLTHVIRGSTVRPIAPVEEVLALQAEA
jgi:hypothetical protein